MLAASAGAFAATTVYTWVDASGQRHYSDQPHPGATKMEVNGAPTFSMPAPPPGESEPPQAAPQGPRATCSIASPSDQQMFMNAWSVSGELRLPPNLNPDDHVTLMLDGKILPNAASLSGAFTLAHIDRGEHTLSAQVEDSDGRVICQAPAVTFYVHQPSRQAPNPANRPSF
jgi:Domain of unknown function (DUF4124)